MAGDVHSRGLRSVMAQKLTHTVEVSETPKDRDDSDSKQKKQLLAVPEDQWVRQRVQSMDAVMTFRKADQAWRPRLISAPPNAAVKYGRKLRRITDEFDVLLDKKRSDLIIIQSVWSDMKKLRQTKPRRTGSPRRFRGCGATDRHHRSGSMLKLALEP